MTQQTAVPSPSVMAQFKRPVIADVKHDSDAKTYDVSHPQVIKAKQLKDHLGAEVRPFVHGQPRGNVRVVEAVSPVDEDHAEWYVEFASSHPAQTYKAAYRFWLVDPSEPAKVVTAPVVDRTAGVNVERLMQEKPKPHVRPEPPEHLTHKPFAGLAALLREQP